MIIEALMQVVFVLFELLTSPISIPSLPDQVHNFLNSAMVYLEIGVGILSNYVDITYLGILVGVVLSVDAGLLIYKLVMWIIRKIPMLGIE